MTRIVSIAVAFVVTVFLIIPAITRVWSETSAVTDALAP